MKIIFISAIKTANTHPRRFGASKMKFCSHCGKELMDEAVVCVNCGCAVNGANSMANAAAGEDIPNGGLNILSFSSPLLV